MPRTAFRTIPTEEVPARVAVASAPVDLGRGGVAWLQPETAVDFERAAAQVIVLRNEHRCLRDLLGQP
jgi:hypothetical protein